MLGFVMRILNGTVVSSVLNFGCFIVWYGSRRSLLCYVRYGLKRWDTIHCILDLAGIQWSIMKLLDVTYKVDRVPNSIRRGQNVSAQEIPPLIQATEVLDELLEYKYVFLYVYLCIIVVINVIVYFLCLLSLVSDSIYIHKATNNMKLFKVTSLWIYRRRTLKVKKATSEILVQILYWIFLFEVKLCWD